MLVVTIVVLIILATISINAVLGEDGLIKQAEKASQMQANAEVSDNDAMGILDKYISDSSTVKKEEGLQIEYTTEEIGKNAKVVKLSYSIGTGKGATAEDIEAKIEEILGETITDDVRTELKAGADSLGLTYEEYLLELLVQIKLEMEITEEVRVGLKAEAAAEGMTYQECLEYILKEGAGISFSPELVTIEDLEEMYVELAKSMGQEITFDETTREQFTQQAASNGMTYNQYLIYVLEYYGVDTSGVTIEVSNGSTIITGNNSKFIATKNGTYTVKATAKNGMQTEEKIEITGVEEEKFSTIYETTTTYTDANGDTATIPAGFAVGTSDNVNKITDGLVITDAVDSSGYSIGNEFVWIPVESDETFIREALGKAEWNTTDYIEPYEGEETEYNTMRTQILEYHGFYIGRYEAGVDSTKFRNNRTEEQDEVVSKKGAVPYNYVEASDAKDSSKKMYISSNSVTSTLCYGVQWDAVCRYIGDYDRTAETKKVVDITGISGEDISKNIYDLAGNCFEWTMENTNLGGVIAYHNVTRGGCVRYQYTISNRGININSSGNFSNDENGFRPTLYIK